MKGYKLLLVGGICFQLLLLVCLLAGCKLKKHYVGNDFSFYSEEFRLDSTSLLQTDGLYVSYKVETDVEDGKREERKGKIIYKFYPKGQVNMVLDLNNDLNSDDDYMDAFNRKISDRSNSNSTTLFEGYYRIKDDKMVIQFLNQPLRQFYYTYAYLKDAQLVIVKTTHIGRGKMKDRYYSPYYKEVYQLVPKPVKGYLSPDW